MAILNYIETLETENQADIRRMLGRGDSFSSIIQKYPKLSKKMLENYQKHLHIDEAIKVNFDTNNSSEVEEKNIRLATLKLWELASTMYGKTGAAKTGDFALRCLRYYDELNLRRLEEEDDDDGVYVGSSSLIDIFSSLSKDMVEKVRQNPSFCEKFVGFEFTKEEIEAAYQAYLKISN